MPFFLQGGIKLKLILFIIILLLLGLLSTKTEFIHYRKILFFIEILLIFMCAFRGITENSSNDTYTYQVMYTDSIGASLKNYFLMYVGNEKVYLILNYFLANLGVPYRMFLVVTGTISVGGPIYFFHKASKNPSFSLLIYIALGAYFINFSTIRQCVAIGILCYGMTFLLQGQNKKYFFVVLLASLFHMASLMMLILLLYKKIKLNRINLILSTLIIVLSFIVFTFFSDILPWKYQAYINTGLNFRIPVFIQIIWFIAQFFLGIFLIKREGTKKSTQIQLSTVTYQIQCMSEMLSLKIDMLSRISLFFIPFNCIYIPNILNPRKSLRLYTLFILLLVIYMIVWLLMNKQMNYL